MNARTLCAFGLLSLRLMGKPTADSKAMIPLPGSGFNGDRYTTLWTKSPFAIATPEAAAASQDYQLVGLAQFDGVSYASLIDKQTQEHFVLSSDKPVKSLTLISVAHSTEGGSAVIQRNGEILTLKQEGAPLAALGQPPMPVNVQGAMPMSTFPTINRSVGGMPGNFFNRPPVRIHHLPITVPPSPPPQ